MSASRATAVGRAMPVERCLGEGRRAVPWVIPCYNPKALLARYCTSMERIFNASEAILGSSWADVPPVVVLFGDEPFFKSHLWRRVRAAVLGDQADQWSLRVFDGTEADWRDVEAELRTVAMFAARRLVRMESADGFVSKNRSALEEYIARPARKSVLVLELSSFPSNTRLYKAVATAGWAVDCSSPAPAELVKWLRRWAKAEHRVQLDDDAAKLLCDLVGAEAGLLDQEIAKLSLWAGDPPRITAELVAQRTGAWRARTAWELIDAALDGKADEALKLLDQLLSSGEQPIGILAQVSATLRRLAAAARLIIRGELLGRRPTLRQALLQAKVHPHFVDRAQRQLERLGRARAKTLCRRLLEADLDLKGDSPLPPRLILERLILFLAAPPNRKLPTRQ